METVLRLAEEAHAEGGAPPIVWGGGAFAILVTLLIMLLVFGKGRPHA